MPIVDITSAAQSVNAALQTQYSRLSTNAQLESLVQSQIEPWRTKLKGMIRRDFPFEEAESRLANWRSAIFKVVVA